LRGKFGENSDLTKKDVASREGIAYLLSMPTATRLPLPKGKITIRHRAMRNVYQCFAGSTYITGASGDYDDEAAQELANQYDVPEGTIATVYGHKEPIQLTIPPAEER